MTRSLLVDSPLIGASGRETGEPSGYDAKLRGTLFDPAPTPV
jgi:hypothetical protein